MAASNLAKELENLEKTWSGLDWWLNFWTALVVIGVAVELIVLAVEYLHEWRDFKRAAIHPPEKPSILVYGLGFVGAALVALGVAGEFRIHTTAGKIESKMRDYTRELVSTVNSEAARAEERASKADERASVNEREAGALRKQAEDETAKRVALEQQLAWRALTDKQRKSLSSPLQAQFAGTTVTVADVMGDAEGALYATEIWGALSKAGWDDSENPGAKGIGNPRAQFFPAGVPAGLRIVERGKEPAARFLQLTLKRAGLDADILLVPISNLPNDPLSQALAANVPVGTLELIVGTKPTHNK